MSKEEILDQVYMQCAVEHASLSKAVRAKVGAVLVTTTGVLVPGYNGTVKGSDNTCEESICDELFTKVGVLHAELNALIKCAKEGISTEGSKLYVTLSPCPQCAAMLAQAGIVEVIYKEKYRNELGIKELIRYNIPVKQIKESLNV